jgi:hypothetical protein
VTLTDAGRDVLDRVFPGHIGVVRDLLVDPLDRSDVESLARVLGTVRDHLRANPPRSAAPRRRARDRA